MMLVNRPQTIQHGYDSVLRWVRGEEVLVMEFQQRAADLDLRIETTPCQI